MARTRATVRLRAWSVVAALCTSVFAAAAPPTRAELAKLCANAEDQAHCGRLIEARQLERLKQVAHREGDELYIELLPVGLTMFRDTVHITGAKTYAVWDYMEDLEAVVLFATDGDRSEFWIVQRRGGAEFRIPSEPVLAPDRRRLATADFCAKDCDNEVAVWRIDASGVRKELSWVPRERWTDVGVAWKTGDTIAVEYNLAGQKAPRSLERRLGDGGWMRVR